MVPRNRCRRDALDAGAKTIEPLAQVRDGLVGQERQIHRHERDGDLAGAVEVELGVVGDLGPATGGLQTDPVVARELLVVALEVHERRRVELACDVLDSGRTPQERRHVAVAGPDAAVAVDPPALDGARVPLLGVLEVREEGVDDVGCTGRGERAVSREHAATLAGPSTRPVHPKGPTLAGWTRTPTSCWPSV